MTIGLVGEPIEVESILQETSAADCGALISFIGTVRNHHHGRRVLRLEYTAYEPMAEREMQSIANTLRDRWPVRAVSMVHRLGVLEIGEASILIALSLAHRKEGFEALRYAIDRFKARVPIWKKEVYRDGASEWVEGS
ncbi:MAG: molybdenum cofactor biosynthesis protein MoaE [Planctomycetota bacterium]